MLQNYIFVPLDVFRKTMEYKGISNKLDAWLAFLSMDSPEMIMELSSKYPEFKAMYEHVYNICQNVEKVMSMYSEELTRPKYGKIHGRSDAGRDRQSESTVG